MPDRIIARADITGTSRIEREETEVVEVRKLERLKAKIQGVDGLTGFAVEIRPETQEFVVLPSDTWCTAAMIEDIRAVLDDIETVFRKAR